MEVATLAACLAAAVAIAVFPRAYASSVLLASVCYVSRGQALEVAGFNFTVLRIIIAAGVVRVVCRREWKGGQIYLLDCAVGAFGVWLVVSGLFHEDGQITNRLRLLYETWGLYGLLRILCRSRTDLFVTLSAVAVLLVPVALAMMVEKVTLHNVFSIFGGVRDTPWIRGGSVRAEGPFANAIMAGNVGAVCLPLVLGLHRRRRALALVGGASCVAMVVASASSGPMVTCLVSIGGLLIFPWRRYLRPALWLAAAAYVLLEVVMTAPPYYLIARIDLAGGSAGWHRARLIESSLEHLGEWWLVGTDRTRHWMPTGIGWSDAHTDITNHFIQLGVLGGVALVLTFLVILVLAFARALRAVFASDDGVGTAFVAWSCAVSLTAHIATCLSVYYFDQSIAFVYLTIVACVAVSISTGDGTAVVGVRESSDEAGHLLSTPRGGRMRRRRRSRDKALVTESHPRWRRRDVAARLSARVAAPARRS